MRTYEDLFGITYERGEVVFRQGDPGDTMFIIQSGGVAISQTHNNHELILGMLEAGDIFGEMALFGNEIRNATATTLQHTRLLSISRQSLLERVQHDPEILYYLMQTLCRRIDKTNLLLKNLIKSDEAVRTSMMQNRLKEVMRHSIHEDRKADSQPVLISSTGWSDMDNAQQLTLAAQETIFNKGDDGDTMFIILDGLVEINQSVDDDQYVIAYLGANDYFGELAILSDIKRTANAVAVRKTTLLPINRQNLMERLREQPDFSISILMLLIQRLRRIMDAMDKPDNLNTYEKISIPTFVKKDKTLKVGIYSLSTCSGCTSVLVDEQRILSLILESAKVVYCPMLMDTQELTQVDIAVVDGMIRTMEDIELIQKIRGLSRKLIAWGTCSCFGGIPAMANGFELEDLIEETYGNTEDVYTYYLSGNNQFENSGLKKKSYTDSGLSLLRKAWKLDDFVRVDFFLPGCPPSGDLLVDLLLEMRGKEPQGKKRSVVCASCDRKPRKRSVEKLQVYPDHGHEAEQCFTAAGVMCMGFLTRGGCGSPCPAGGLPCWGCRGPSEAVLKKIGSDGNYERHVVRSFARRSKLSAEEVEPIIDIMRCRTNNLMTFFQSIPINPAKIR